MTSRSPVWHPFTQHAVQPEAIMISKGEGAWLEASDGRRIFDAISSWWVVTHGHRHPHIMQAIKDQADRLDQVIFAGFTHEPAEKLARHLVAITPPELEYVFFSDSGSTSVEVALKMGARVLAASRQQAQPHSGAGRRLSRRHHRGYVGRRTRRVQCAIRSSAVRRRTDPVPASGREEATLNALTAACKRGDVAALIVEPLILGAGGMLNLSAADSRGNEAHLRRARRSLHRR